MTLAADSVLLHQVDPIPLHKTESAPLHETLSERKRRFEQLVLPHFDAAYNLARWLTRNDQDARDVVHSRTQAPSANSSCGFIGFN